MSTRLPPRATVYLWSTAVAAGCVLLSAVALSAGSAASAEQVPAAGALAQLFVFAAVAQHFPLSFGPQRKFDLSITAHLAILLLASAPLGIVLIGAGEAVGQVGLMLRRHPKTRRRLRGPHAALFNTSQMTLAAAVAISGAAATRAYVAGWEPAGGWWTAVAPTLVAGAALYLVNSWAVALMVGLSSARNPVTVWREGRAWSAMQAAGLLTLGALTAHAASASPWVTVVMALPVVLTYVSLKRTAEAEAAVQLRDEFLGLAAHELRTPLTSLRGYAQLVANQADKGVLVDEVKLARCLRTIDRQSGKLCDLIDRLLDVSRLEVGHLTLQRKPVDVTALAREVTAALQPLTPDYRLEVVAPGPVYAQVDPMRVEQVLTNLLTNAARYAGKGDRIDVEVQSTPQVLRPPRAAGAGAMVRLAVRDYGVGIAPEHRERIFDRFYQAGAGSKAGGLGVGLYITRQIVELHGGRLVLECPPDGGSRFIATLPAATIVPFPTPLEAAEAVPSAFALARSGHASA